MPLPGNIESVKTTQIVVLITVLWTRRGLIDGFADGAILAKSLVGQK